MGRLGLSEILVILVVALLLFGAGRIADIGKGLGEGIKNFKKGIRDDDESSPKPAVQHKELEGAEAAAKLPAKSETPPT